MLKFINLNKLTAKTLIGILVAGSFLSLAGTKKTVAAEGVQGLELRYEESAFQCGANGTQANIKVKVFNQKNNLLAEMSKGDTFKTSEIDSVSDLKFKYKIKNTCYEENWRNSQGSQLLGVNDIVPSVGGAYAQASITEMLSDLDSYEELYLVELGTNDTSSSTYDLQDVVLVVDHNPESLVAAQENINPDVETVTSPDKITLTGTVRDFKDDHPDFESTTGDDRNLVTTELGADKKPVYAHGSEGTRTTTNKTSFDQWYRDVNGVNKKTQHSIELTKQPDGTYKYQNHQFFPINGQLWGNYKDGKNYHFTYEIHNKFTYRGGEIFTFSGDDDVWVYIDGKRVIDIGGVHLSQTDSVSLDSLGLTIGETYDLDFFFAERHYSHSNFTITTSIELEATLDPDADEDSDGISNILEGFETEVDSDDDGTDDYLDEDSDNNGIPDSIEVGTVANPSDSDGDGTPNFQDDDDDGNGILDVDEIGDDPNYPTNTDGVDLPDYQDTDDDNDGISDVVEGMVDSELDDDDIPNHHDTDSDGDGIDDSVETDEDSALDDDTDPNFLDLDSDGDTIPDSVETGEDSELDDDTDPNFLDLDSDGDNIPDENEEIADSNDEGEETDVTNEDLDDDGNTSNVDGDDQDNFLDLDSDNDGLDDNIDPEPYVYTYAD